MAVVCCWLLPNWLGLLASTLIWAEPATVLTVSERWPASAWKLKLTRSGPSAPTVASRDTDDSTLVLNLASAPSASLGGTEVRPSTASWNDLDRPAMAVRSSSVSLASPTSICTPRPFSLLSSVTVTLAPLAVVMRNATELSATAGPLGAATPSTGAAARADGIDSE
ncbi:Uncharacterised protein [Achromobacter sp. 2789STDY5608628]|nr:Uncharacterised protein [Achromobacter sp. 2789STDY5608628]